LKAARYVRAAFLSFWNKPILENIYISISKLMKHYLQTLIFLLISVNLLQAQDFEYQNRHNKNRIILTDQGSESVRFEFSMKNFSLHDIEIKGERMKEIQMDGVFLPGEEGSPNLPAISRYVAIPKGAEVKLKAIYVDCDTIRNVNIAPAPRIPLDTDRGPLAYSKNEKVFSVNEFYPKESFQVSEKTDIRGVDVVIVGIIPFKYNPVSKELIVFHTMDVELDFEGGNGTFGEERLRSRWFDPILQDVIINYESLPVVDYSLRNNPQNRQKNTGFEYLIVVPNDPAWLPYANQMKDFRTKQGISTGIVTLSEIGGNTVAALESYFNNAYNTWNPAPVAVLLMADYGTNETNSIIAPVWNFYCASDNIYADVNYDQLPDIIFARMTAQNTDHLQTMVSKIINYETNPPMDYNFYHKPVTTLGWQTERWFQICSEVVGGYWREVQGKTPVRINDIYEGTPAGIWSTATNTSTVINYFGPSGRGYIPLSPTTLGGWSGGTAQMIVNSINDGAFAVQHRDHGYEYGWGEPYFTNSSISLLNNNQNNELPFVFSINCLTGKYNISDECFTEKFHRYTYNGQNAGALGLIAASEISYSFVNDVYVWGMFDNFYSDFLPDYGPYVEERGFIPAFGNAAGKYFLQQSSWPYNSGNKEVTHHLFHHHGCAFLTVFSEVPQTLTVIHDTIQYNWQNSFSVTANPGAFISLTCGEQIIGTAESNGQEQVIYFDPLPEGSEIIVTATKQNFLRYEQTVEVIAPIGPYVIADVIEINDAGATFPNNLLDYGETISLNFIIKNIGLVAANNVLASLSTTDPNVNITGNHYLVGNVNPNEELEISDAFVVEVSGNIPDGLNLEFVLTFTNDRAQWQSAFTVVANAPLLEVDEIFVNDSGGNHDGFLDPGETAPVRVTLKNNGHSPAFSIYAALSSTSPYLEIETTDPQIFGNLSPSESRSAWFYITANGPVPSGIIADANLGITADFELEQEDQIQFSFSDYCIPSANCSYGDGIRSFALKEVSNMNNGCSTGGYGNFTSMIASLNPGETYMVSLKGGYSNQKASLWIDFNSNKVFETSEMLIENFTLTSSAITYTKNITIPAGINPGAKRLRVRAQYQNSSSNPCSNFTYGETEDYTVNIVDPNVTTQQIVLSHGWNSISGYLAPENTNMEILFGEILDQLVIVQNTQGVFWPSQTINTLGLWNPYKGYQVKTNAEATFTIQGTPAEPGTLQLNAGWNLMPVLSACQVSTSDLFAPHLEKLVIIKDAIGVGTFWPDQGINTLPVLIPGKSYFILMNDNVLLEFEPCPTRLPE